MWKRYFFPILLLVAGCASKTVIPTIQDVRFSKVDPPTKCEEVGLVQGTTNFANGTTEEAIDDMKKDAAHKGANYVKFGQLSGTGTVVTGVAFKCP